MDAEEGAAGTTPEVSREKADADRLSEASAEVHEFLEGLLEALGAQGEIQVAVGPSGEVAASLSGEDAGLLIGRKGKTMEALQELVRAAVQRHVGFGIKVSLDIEGYRERRLETLKGLTHTMIQEARNKGEAELEPMSAYERKIVHDLVAEQQNMTSFSEGQDPDRRVIIRTTSEPPEGNH